MAVAYIALSVLWLVAGVLFLLKQAHWFGVGIAVGLGLSRLCLQLLAPTHLARGAIMLLAATAGMAGVLAVSALVIRRTLLREAAASPVGNQPVVLASSAQLLVGLAPYFGYGVLYVAFILSGHVGGWVGAMTSAAAPMEAISTIEVGLTVALGGYILAGGMAERTMRRFWQQVRVHQAETPQARPDAFSRILQGFFLREHAHFLAAVGAVQPVRHGKRADHGSPQLRNRSDPAAVEPETTIVFSAGSNRLWPDGFGHVQLHVHDHPFPALACRHSVVTGIAVTIVVGLPDWLCATVSVCHTRCGGGRTRVRAERARGCGPC